MPKFLDTHGNKPIAIGICARCSVKMPVTELVEDPNAPGLLVCPEDRDQYDPYRLAARSTEDITFANPRPDVAVDGEGNVTAYPQPLDGVSTIKPSSIWKANTSYTLGAQITPVDPDDENVTLPVYEFLCIQAGQSGAFPPTWPTNAGVVVTDGAAKWLCRGIYLM